jgi:hypothetical protein
VAGLPHGVFETMAHFSPIAQNVNDRRDGAFEDGMKVRRLVVRNEGVPQIKQDRVEVR